MSSAPSDLLAFRAEARAVTGLSAVEVGVVGDGAHQRTGGPHEGMDVLVAIGRYHGPATAHVGSTVEDYSARQLRDRLGLTDDASAVDIGDDWPNGGRAAWLRFNRLLYAEMRDHPENLPALRAINVTLDGTTKQRFDQLHRDQGLIASTDTVTTHTHAEFWRDTAGRRAATLNRIVQLIQAAIANTAPPPPEGDAMAGFETSPAWINTHDRIYAMLTGAPYGAATSVPFADKLSSIAADAKAGRVAIEALTGLINGGGGSIDTAAVLAKMDTLAADDKARDESQTARIAQLEAELADVKAAAEANLSPAERDALNQP